MRRHTRRRRYAGHAQECHLQLQSRLSEQEDTPDKAQDVSVRGRQLSRDQVVLALDEGTILLFLVSF